MSRTVMFPFTFLVFAVGLFGLVTIRSATLPTQGSLAGLEPDKERDVHTDYRILDPGARARGETRIENKALRFAKNGPKRYDEPQQAMEFFMDQRLAPGAAVLPLEKLRTALDGVKRRELALRGGVAAAVTPWTEIGPGNIGGRTRALVIDPTNPSIIYAAGVAGGVWKSSDAGASWTATDDFMLNIAVSSLVMDPANPLVLYAGTGEGFFNGDSVRGLGIFKTTDGGSTWNQLAGTVTGVPFGAFFRVNDIVVSPANSNRVYAGTRHGVWQSTNAGATWSIQLSNPSFGGGLPFSNGSSAGCLDLAIRTDTSPGSDVLLASFGSFGPDGLFRSTDSGSTWTQVGTALDVSAPNQGRMQIDIAPSNNNVMYVSMADNGDTGNSTGTMVNVFRSADGGITWSPRLNFANSSSAFLLSNIVFSSACGGSDNFAQGWYGNIIKVDPADSNIVWVGGIDLFRSDDGGANFGLTSYWWFDPSDSRYVHADQHAIAFHPNYDGFANQTMYSGSDGGLARTDNARAATTANMCGSSPFPSVAWTGLNNGYGVTQFYWGDTAKGSDIFGGGCQDNGTLLVSSTATPDSWIEIMGGDGGYFSIDPNNSSVMYAEFQNFPRIRKSTNGGLSFFDATSGITDTDGLFITPFEMAQGNSQVLWTGGTRAWRSLSGAASWSLGSANLSGADTISAIAIFDGDPNIVYLGYTNGVVAKTTNGLAVGTPSWTVFGSGSGLSNGWVSSVAIDPQDSNVAYATYSTFDVPHILRTTNGGASWTSIDGPAATGVPDIPVHHLAIRPCDSTQLFVGTDLGVFVSDDDGTTWTPANTGLSHTVVEKLDYQDDDTLVAFTHGRGVFRTTLSPACGANCSGINPPAECRIKFSQPVDETGEDIASNIDWVDDLPNIVVADDFISDGRPITGVRWWGSNLGDAPLPCDGLDNDGFETGDFTGWTVTNNGLAVFCPWVVDAGAGNCWTTFGDLPLSGSWDASTGFDGAAGLVQELYQTITLPISGPITLTTNHRIQYDGFGIPSSLPRLLDITIRDTFNNALTTLFQQEVIVNGAPPTDLGWNTQVFDISGFAGQTVRVHFQVTISESFTGPGTIEFDDITITCGVPTNLGALTNGLPATSQQPIDAKKRPTIANRSMDNQVAQYLTLRDAALALPSEIRREAKVVYGANPHDTQNAVEQQMVQQSPTTASGVGSCLFADGNFETGTLIGSWSQTNAGSGSWVINDGVFVPNSGDGPLAPCGGNFSVVTDQGGPGRHLLFQDVTIPATATSATLQWTDMIRNFAGGGFSDPNQEFRVTVRDSITGNLLATLFSTNPGDPLVNTCTSRSADISAFIGQTIRIMFEEEDNIGFFNVHLDDVCVDVVIPGPAVGPDGWFIGFHEHLLEGGPAALPLGVYYCDKDIVQELATTHGACDTHPVNEYVTDLADCCLVHSNPDARSGLFPAEVSGFFEQECFQYDLDIQAVIGHEFIADGLGNCIEVPTGRSATEEFWAWQTTAQDIGASFGLRKALTSNVTMSGSDWLYGPWSLVTPVCSQPNMAFELITSTPHDGDPDLNGNGVPDVCNDFPDTCPSAFEIFNGDTAFDTTFATTLGLPLPLACEEGNGVDMAKELWFTYTPLVTGTLQVSTCNQANFDTRLAAYTNNCETLSLLGCNDDADGCAGFTSLMELPITAGEVVLLRVGGYGVSATNLERFGTGVLTLTALDTAPPDLLPDPIGQDFDRSLGIVIPAASPGNVAAAAPTDTAIRITLDSLYHPGAPLPVNPPDFSAREGEVRYVNFLRDEFGVPVTSCLDSPAFLTFYRCATVSCQPEYADWAGIFGGDTVHLSGSSIIPDSSYSLAHLAASCAGSELSCTSVSADLVVATARYADVDNTSVVNVTDVVLVIDVVKAIVGATQEYTCYVRKESPEPQNDAPNVTDIVMHVDAVKLVSYPLNVPACP